MSLSLHYKRYLTNLINFVAGDVNEKDEKEENQDQRADDDLNDIFVERQAQCCMLLLATLAASCNVTPFSCWWCCW